MKKKLIIIGSGGHAKSCIDIIEQQNNFKIFALVDVEKNLGRKICGYKVKYKDSDLINLRKKCSYAAVAIGQIHDVNPRLKSYLKLKKLRFKLPVFISKNSYISKRTKIGEGTFIFNGVVINPDAVIGKNCIINSKSLIEHDTTVGDNCHISTGAKLNGCVNVGNNSFIGSGSVIKNNIHIKKNSFIPMGSIIIK
tara:strand:+ start:195 stop:779 length:585 start_codon:yes stop_codon:yes gene_type:complete